MEKAESTEALHCQLQQLYVASSMDEREAEPFISDSNLLQLRLGLLNPSLDNDQLLCIEYVCEFGLGFTKELVASAKDDRGRVVFDVLYTVLFQQLDDALSLLSLILKRLDYNTDNGEIKNELSKLPALNSDKEEEIYGKYPKLDMWLTLTIAMTSMSEDDYTKLRDHVLHEVLSDSHNTDHIESCCHLLELVNNQPQPDEVNSDPLLDPKDLSTVLKWFEDCSLEYPNEIRKYQQRREILVDGPTIVQSVLDGNDLTSKKYQEKYSSYSKTRTWWMDQLIEYPTEKETELQRYIQLLQDKLQVLYQNKVSLQEALVESNKQGMCIVHYTACNSLIYTL